VSTILETVVGVASAGGLVLLIERMAFRSKPSTKQRRLAIAEKRRILERDRSEWYGMLSNNNVNVVHRVTATKSISIIDDKLMALADEEGKLDGD
jgi:hypothetical protein